MSEITLVLAGPVRLMDSDGTDLTPASMKGRGLLALLGTASGQRMARVKVQDKLWSDRGGEQGSASLRQALSELRRSLGDRRDILLSGPGWVGLDANKVDVVSDPPPETAAATVEFAQDLEIADPEFEDWLMLQRSHFADRWQSLATPAVTTRASIVTTGARLPVVLTIIPGSSERLEGFAEAVLRDASTRAAEFLDLEILASRSLDYQADGMELTAAVFGPPGAFILNAALVRTTTGRQMWSKSFSLAEANIAQDLRVVSGEITAAILFAASETENWTGDPIPSLSDIFSFSRTQLLRADKALAAGTVAPSRLAMRAYIRNTMLVERLSPDPEGTREEAREIAAQALALAPQSSTVLATASLISARERDFELAADLSERAVRADPGNPLARHSLSMALSFSGDHHAAHREAEIARVHPLSAFNPATLATSCAVTAIRVGDFDQALRFAAIAHGYAPDFRAPLRLLGALRYRAGDAEGAAKALESLRKLEPDFSLELMASKDYPVATLRDARLLQVTKSQLV